MFDMELSAKVTNNWRDVKEFDEKSRNGLSKKHVCQDNGALAVESVMTLNPVPRVDADNLEVGGEHLVFTFGACCSPYVPYRFALIVE